MVRLNNYECTIDQELAERLCCKSGENRRFVFSGQAVALFCVKWRHDRWPPSWNYDVNSCQLGFAPRIMRPTRRQIGSASIDAADFIDKDSRHRPKTVRISTRRNQVV